MKNKVYLSIVLTVFLSLSLQAQTKGSAGVLDNIKSCKVILDSIYNNFQDLSIDTFFNNAIARNFSNIKKKLRLQSDDTLICEQLFNDSTVIREIFYLKKINISQNKKVSWVEQIIVKDQFDVIRVTKWGGQYLAEIFYSKDEKINDEKKRDILTMFAFASL